MKALIVHLWRYSAPRQQTVSILRNKRGRGLLRSSIYEFLSPCVIIISDATLSHSNKIWCLPMFWWQYYCLRLSSTQFLVLKEFIQTWPRHPPGLSNELIRFEFHCIHLEAYDGDSETLVEVFQHVNSTKVEGTLGQISWPCPLSYTLR